MITLPSWDISRPAPTPNRASESLNASRVQLHVDRVDHDTAATTIASSPTRTTSLGASRAESFGPLSAAMQHRHRHRQQALPGLERIEPEHDLQVDGKHEEGPHQDELLRHQRRQAGSQRRDLEQRRSSSVSLPRRSRCSPRG